jgi:hypothetical protein
MTQGRTQRESAEQCRTEGENPVVLYTDVGMMTKHRNIHKTHGITLVLLLLAKREREKDRRANDDSLSLKIMFRRTD